ncbi:hypothetical protein HUG10_13125 [Halorarum halophilum]|uniref:Uncharacterized protein n=1 Tax=Halorarum halophilum TaxID=2743090 RepID=A0A7D5GIV4_9EURY|nr:hypothetical protein [Halobaculum halophilum]QLG28431.1 hypothetical protein HUG10_13125 [Halobaculum halophilum]
MRELDCDFCGARAAGAYEVLPDELDPTPDEQVRVVLCGNCRDTLDAVTAPLLARLGVDDTDRPSGAALRDASRPSGTAGDDEDDGPEDGAQASARSENPVSPADDAVIIDSGARREPRSTDDRRGNADAGATDAPPQGDEPGGGDDGEDDDGRDVGDGRGDDGSTEGADRNEDAAASANGDSSRSGGGTGRGRAEEPEEFRTVMRLLNNREFPVDRGEVVDLASGAYELETAQVEEILDYAVERGILSDEKGKLTKA